MNLRQKVRETDALIEKAHRTGAITDSVANAANAAMNVARKQLDGYATENKRMSQDAADDLHSMVDSALSIIKNGTLSYMADDAPAPTHRTVNPDADPVASHAAYGTGPHDRAKRTVEQLHTKGLLPDFGAERVTRLIAEGASPERQLAARWAAAAGSMEYLSAFAKLAADPTRGHMKWTPEEAEAYRAVDALKPHFQKDMQLGTGTGSELVPLTLDPSIILTNDGAINPLRAISRVVQTATDKWQGVTSAGATAEWKAEATEVADGSPTLADPSIPVHLADCFVPYSFEIGQDAVDFLGELRPVMVDAVQNLLATAYTSGSGTGQPTGVHTALAASSNPDSEIAPATAETLASADVYTVQNTLPARFSARAQWAAHISTINKLAQFETTNGAKQFPEVANDRLLRKPLHENSNQDAYSDVNPAVTAAHRVLLYGDFSQYVIVDRIGAQVELVPHLFGTNNRPTGQRGILVWLRTGADVVVDQAFVQLNVATTAP